MCAGSAGSACGRFRAVSGSGVLPGLMCWRRHSRLVLSGLSTFTTWTGRSPAARSTWSVTVDPFSRRDKRHRWRDPITRWQAPASRAASISPEAGSPDLTSSKVPPSSPSSLRSFSSRPVGGSRSSQRADVHRLEPGVGKPGEVGGVADKPLISARSGARVVRPPHPACAYKKA